MFLYIITASLVKRSLVLVTLLSGEQYILRRFCGTRALCAIVLCTGWLDLWVRQARCNLLRRDQFARSSTQGPRSRRHRGGFRIVSGDARALPLGKLPLRADYMARTVTHNGGRAMKSELFRRLQNMTVFFFA
jgi:hypothetical protein